MRSASRPPTTLDPLTRGGSYGVGWKARIDHRQFARHRERNCAGPGGESREGCDSLLPERRGREGDAYQVRTRGSDGVLVHADVTRPEQITDMFRKLKAR